MQKDILEFAVRSLVPNGRLAMWMPTAMEDVDLPFPMHLNLELISVSTQSFHNCRSWARAVSSCSGWVYMKLNWIRQGLGCY